MGTRERDEQAEQERQQLEQEQERTSAPRGMQVEGDDETSNPVIINK